MAYPNNYSPQGASPYQQQASPEMPSAYQLTRDEKRILKECAQESFYRRCVPLMTALGLGAYYGVHLGYLKGHATYNAAPKVATGMIVGFIAGKLSYKNKCEEKILNLPGGKLKESLLMAKKGTIDNSGLYKDASITYALPPYATVPFRSSEPSTASELDTERHHDTFDDSFRIRSGFNNDNAISNDSDDLQHLVPPPHSTTYDELRNRNREEYDVRRKQYRSGPVDDYAPFTGPYSPGLPPSDRFSKTDAYQSPTAAADRTSRTDTFHTTAGGLDNQSPDRHYSSEQTVSSQQRGQTQRKNFYGDIIEK